MTAVVRPAGEPAAAAWLAAAGDAVEAIVPELAFAETAHVLARYTRAGQLSARSARDKLQAVVEAPLRPQRVRPLAARALEAALARGLSAYDACYLILATERDAVLVTADRRLAGAAAQSALLPDALPPAR